MANKEDSEVTVDLTGKNYQANVFKMLDDPQAWRLRAVERIDFSSALWAERQRTVHAKPLRIFLGDDAVTGEGGDRGTNARLVLPVVSFPRKPRIDLHITVAEEPAYLLSGKDAGRYKSAYFEYLAHQVVLPDGSRVSERFRPDGMLRTFLADLFTYYPWRWRETTIKWNYRSTNKDKVLMEYFKSFEDWKSLEGGVIQQWIGCAGAIGELVRKDGRPSFRESATENPLLAVPMSSLPQQDVDCVLKDLLGLLKDSSEVADDPSSSCREGAKKVLEVYAYYGRFWVALVECTVPLDEPFMIRVSERRVLDFGKRVPSEDGVFDPVGHRSLRKQLLEALGQPAEVRHLVVFKDAQSNILNVRVPDNHVQLKEKKWRVEEDPGSGNYIEPDDVIDSGELFSYYSANPKRSKMLWFVFPLQQTLPRRITITFTCLTLLVALFGVAVIGFDGFKFDVGQYVTILLIPASFAGSLLLVRVNSTLGSQVNAAWHALAALLLFGLWSLTVILALAGKFHYAEKSSPGSTPAKTSPPMMPSKSPRIPMPFEVSSRPS